MIFKESFYFFPETLRLSLTVENLGHLERLVQRTPKFPVANESFEWQD